MFTSTLHPACWRDLQTDAELPVPSLAGKQVVAFCGLANPDSFRRTLAECAVQLMDFRIYPDHHWFSDDEIRDLRERSANYTLVTTDKDAARLPRMAAYALLVRSLTPGLTAFVTSALPPPRSVIQL